METKSHLYIGENIMKIFEKKKLILTEWDNSIQSTRNFNKAIEELRKENIPFVIIEKRIITDYAKKIYFTYSIILDSILLLTILLALINADKILQLIGG
tara:strand:+ start:297 stop:593 length:297 start_codon:yes stop_codon:yes gene_type:complete